MFQRCFAAAGFPVAYSRGFHPHMRMSFGPPLKTGWEGYDEYMDVHLEEPVDEFADRSNAFLPEGLRVSECAEVADGTPKLARDIDAADYTVRVGKGSAERANGHDARAAVPTEDELKNQFAGADDTDGKLPKITGVTIHPAGDDICIEYTSTMLSGRIVAPHNLVAAAFGDPDTFPVPIAVARTAQYVTRDGDRFSPLSREIIQG
jgi:radical SAM-linked protein